MKTRLRAAVPVSYDFEPVALPEGEIVVHSGGVVVQRPHYQCGYNRQKKDMITSLERHLLLTVLSNLGSETVFIY